MVLQRRAADVAALYNDADGRVIRP
jgi:hypothetical protein